MCKLLGSLRVTTGRSDAELDEPHHSVSYFCQMSFPHIDALFHAVAHKSSDTVICLFLLSAVFGEHTDGAVANRFSCLINVSAFIREMENFGKEHLKQVKPS